MERVTLDGGEFELEVRGAGEPVVLVHGSHIADAFAPLLAEPALLERYRLISYHRRGFAGSPRPAGPLSIAQQAADCRTLMRSLGVEQAHVVGHSYGGVIALQLALDATEAVHSLALLEPALLRMVPSSQLLVERLGPVAQMYAAGDKARAVDAFLEMVCGAGYRAVLDRVVPGGFTQAMADADTFFRIEMPALQEWSFTREAAGRITQPVLAVLGADSDAVWPAAGEGHRLLREWLPQAEPLVVPDVTHALQMQNPRGVAEGLAAFFARHPLSSAAASS
jgi:pimeloyl-ACP methyl ester carboxylesterase